MPVLPLCGIMAYCGVKFYLYLKYAVTEKKFIDLYLIRNLNFGSPIR